MFSNSFITIIEFIPRRKQRVWVANSVILKPTRKQNHGDGSETNTREEQASANTDTGAEKCGPMHDSRCILERIVGGQREVRSIRNWRNKYTRLLPEVETWPKRGDSYLVQLLHVRAATLYSNKYHKLYHTLLSHIVKCFLSLILRQILIFKNNLLHVTCNKTDKEAVSILIPRTIHHMLSQV
jgi:hypothetical protein